MIVTELQQKMRKQLVALTKGVDGEPPSMMDKVVFLKKMTHSQRQEIKELITHQNKYKMECEKTYLLKETATNYKPPPKKLPKAPGPDPMMAALRVDPVAQ